MVDLVLRERERGNDELIDSKRTNLFYFDLLAQLYSVLYSNTLHKHQMVQAMSWEENLYEKLKINFNLIRQRERERERHTFIFFFVFII